MEYIPVLEFTTTATTTPPPTSTRRPYAAKQVRKIEDSAEKPKSTPLNEFEWKVGRVWAGNLKYVITM